VCQVRAARPLIAVIAVVPHATQDPALCAAARDRLWSLNETQQLRREDPTSWVGPLSGDDLSSESKNAFSAYRWNCRIPGSEDVLRDLFPRNPVVLAIAEQLLGRGRLSDPDSETRGTRGVYCTLPMGDKPKSRSSCHIDDYIDSRTRIDAVCYIDDVKPGSGSFVSLTQQRSATTLPPRCLLTQTVAAVRPSGRARITSATASGRPRRTARRTATPKPPRSSTTGPAAPTADPHGRWGCRSAARK